MPDTLVFIPAWNEAENLPGVLDELQQELPDVDVLVVAGNVVRIGMGRQQVRDVQAVALDGVVQGLERGAGVDEDGRPAALVADEVGVREPARMHRPLDDHRAVR